MAWISKPSSKRSSNHDGNGFLGNDNAFSSLTEPLDKLGVDNPGVDAGASSLADSSAGEHDFSSDGGDGLGGDGFDGGGDSMLG